MSSLLLYCSIGNHAKCSARGCSCDCHDIRQTPPQPGDAMQTRILAFHCRAGQHDQCPCAASICKCPCHKLAPFEPFEERSVTDTLKEAASIIETRIAEIDEELARYTDLRAQRKELEGALRRLRPSAKSASNGTSTASRILATINGTTREWTTDDLASTIDAKKTTVQPVADRLVREKKLERVRPSTYKAAG